MARSEGSGCSVLRRIPVAAAISVLILSAAGQAAGDVTEDARVAQRIAVRLSGQVGIDQRDSSIDVSDGIVTLRGSVGSLGERERVVRLVSGIVGVSGVINEITVRVSSRPDAGIQQEIVSLLQRRPRFRDGAVTVLVSGGVARLEGEVDRSLDRLDAEIIASNVEGVTGVENGIGLLSEGMVAPELILDRVRGMLRNPLTFNLIRDLSVSVDQAGVVLLQGTARQPSHREEAERLALSVPGVTGVINRILPPTP